MKRKIVTATLIFIHDMFRPYMAIIRCPCYAKLFTVKTATKIQIKVARPIKFSKNGFDLVGPISVIFGGVDVFHVVR
jgi:hypothetical protein